MSKQIPEQYSPDWLEKLDHRTSLAKAVTERLCALTSDLGGPDALSYQQKSLCKRAIWSEAILEQMEVALGRGQEVDLGRYTQAINTLIGLFKTLGLERRARDVPNLEQFLKQRASA